MIPYCILVLEEEEDQRFMEELFLQYQRLMYGEILRIVHNYDNAEDVLQTVLLKLIEKLDLLRSRDREHRINYIISTCKNTARNYIRDNSRPQTSYQEWMETASVTYVTQTDAIEQRMIHEEEVAQLAHYWSVLDPDTRQLLEGYYVLKKPMAQLGREMGIKAASVRMALTRARKKAYAQLKAQMDGPPPQREAPSSPASDLKG